MVNVPGLDKAKKKSKELLRKASNTSIKVGKQVYQNVEAAYSRSSFSSEGRIRREGVTEMVPQEEPPLPDLSTSLSKLKLKKKQSKTLRTEAASTRQEDARDQTPPASRSQSKNRALTISGRPQSSNTSHKDHRTAPTPGQVDQGTFLLDGSDSEASQTNPTQNFSSTKAYNATPRLGPVTSDEEEAMGRGRPWWKRGGDGRG